MNIAVHLRLCSGCREAPARNQARASYCLECHAQKTREWRSRNPYHTLPAVVRFKSSMRSIANIYQRRGKIEQRPCVLCDSEHSEKHHPDYSKPLEIIWLCRDCHLDLHDAVFHNQQSVEHLAEEWDRRRKQKAPYLRREMATRIAMRKLAKKHVSRPKRQKIAA